MNKMEKIVSLAKRRGFIYPGSEIYGGLRGFWDYGPLGVELKNNIKQEWWKNMVYEREDIIGIDTAIIMNPKVWEISGHTEAFTDPLVECKICNRRFRVDHLVGDEDILKVLRKEAAVRAVKSLKESSDLTKAALELIKGVEIFLKAEGKKPLTKSEREKIIKTCKPFLKKARKKINEAKVKIDFTKWLVNQIELSKRFLGAVIWIYLGRYKFCPECKGLSWTPPKTFNLLTEVYLGTTKPKQNKNILDSTSMKIPFGIAQIGKAFRNEITPGNFTYRSREFEQMELEYFIEPDEKEAEKIFNYWKKERMDWYVSCGMKKENLRFREHGNDERAHYARFAEDVEYKAPFGWSEFEGIHHRGDWDLGRHKLTYKDGETGKEYTPWVIETSGGVDRTALFFLIDAYHEEEERVILKLHPKLAPYKAAVFPLLANKPELVKKARKIYEDLSKKFPVAWDDRGNIGKRYFAQDEIGTPWCITVDFETLKDDTVTVRDRDTTKQERVSIDKLNEYLENKIEE
jgi:glycyl-tRNA synthetase